MNATLHFEPPASAEELHRLKTKYEQLPQPYLTFLGQANGAEGDLGVHPGWFIVWPAEEALVATVEYQMPEYLPGYFAFGGNGGGEIFVFELLSSDSDREVFMVPAIGMARSELLLVARSFSEFQRQMGEVFPEGA